MTKLHTMTIHYMTSSYNRTSITNSTPHPFPAFQALNTVPTFSCNNDILLFNAMEMKYTFF